MILISELRPTLWTLLVGMTLVNVHCTVLCSDVYFVPYNCCYHIDMKICRVFLFFYWVGNMTLDIVLMVLLLVLPSVVTAVAVTYPANCSFLIATISDRNLQFLVDAFVWEWLHRTPVWIVCIRSWNTSLNFQQHQFHSLLRGTVWHGSRQDGFKYFTICLLANLQKPIKFSSWYYQLMPDYDWTTPALSVKPRIICGVDIVI